MNMDFILKLAKQLDTVEFREVLRYLYIDEALSLRSMADILNVSHSQIFNLLKKYGVSRDRKKC